MSDFMILDGHIHVGEGAEDRTTFWRELTSAGVAGGVIISLPPKAFPAVGHSAPPQDRLDNVFSWAEEGESLYPFYWVDPMESDAIQQVEIAAKQGIFGFKIICHSYYPSDRKAMEVFAAIAEARRPILFHSGVLWDGTPSSRYNRPAEFEALLEIKGLKFALAHVSWPWCDELIAVYGKFLNSNSRTNKHAVEMYIDIAPGTPQIYRREVLTKLFTVGYDIENNVLFGSDCEANNYDTQHVAKLVKIDNEIYHSIGLKRQVQEKLYAKNLMRFLAPISGP